MNENDNKKNTDVIHAFSKQIGRTNYVVGFAFKKDSTETMKDKTRKLIMGEIAGKKS